MNHCKKLLIPLLFSLHLLSCQSQSIDEIVGNNNLWIKGNLNWETDSSDFQYTGNVFKHARGVLIYLREEKQVTIVYATFFIMAGSDTISFEMTEGGALYKGKWKSIDNRSILIESRLFSDKRVYPIGSPREEIGSQKLDILEIYNSNLLELNNKIYLMPLQQNLSNDCYKVL
jgi:hypothetical protein